MRHFIQYHNLAERGLPPGAWSERPQRIAIESRRAAIQAAVGGTVFLLGGYGRPRHFHLWQAVKIEQVSREPSGVWSASGLTQMQGLPRRLSGRDFTAFQKSCAGFVGFRQIDELPYCRTLQRLAQERPTEEEFIRETRTTLPCPLPDREGSWLLNNSHRACRKLFAQQLLQRGSLPANDRLMLEKLFAVQDQEAALTEPDVALSVRQPHAAAILVGRKLIEYRSTPTNRRGRVWIYAPAARYQPDDEARWLCDYGLATLAADDLIFGHVVGNVEIVDCEQRGPRDFHWHLARPRFLLHPFRPRQMPQPVWFRPR